MRGNGKEFFLVGQQRGLYGGVEGSRLGCEGRRVVGRVEDFRIAFGFLGEEGEVVREKRILEQGQVAGIGVFSGFVEGIVEGSRGSCRVWSLEGQRRKGSFREAFFVILIFKG